MWHYQLGLSAPNPNQRTFREKSFGISKAFAKVKWCVCTKVLRIFKELFQKLLKARFGTAVPTYYEKLKTRIYPRFFCVALSVGAIRPKPRPKKLFGKSFLELQKLFQNKAVCSVGNSLAYLSYKKGKSFFITATAKTYDEKRSNTKFIPL